MSTERPHTKLLFDECVGTRIIEPLSALLDEHFSHVQVTLRHVLEFQQQGIHDEVWIPQVAEDEWIILSADAGKRGGKKKGRKLPMLCELYRITHIIMSSTLHHHSSFEKMTALFSVWPDLLDVPNAPRGSRYALRRQSAGGPVKLILVKEAESNS